MAKKVKPVYEPYVSKSDRQKGLAKGLKKAGRAGNVTAMIQANAMLSPEQPSVPQKYLNQQQKRKRARQQPHGRK